MGTAKGERWRSGWDSMNALVRPDLTIHLYGLPDPEERVLAGDGEYWMYLTVDRSFYQQVRSGSMRVHARLALTLLSPQQTTLLTLRDGPQAVPDGGFCLVRAGRRFLETNCQWPGRLPACLHVHLRTGLRNPAEPGHEVDRIDSYAPFPIWGGLWQSDSLYLNANAPPFGADLVTRNAVAHFERELDIPDLREWTNR